MAQQYRAEHIGSLLRPPEIFEARTAHQAGQLDDARLAEVEDRAILTALDMQRQVGIDVLSDGEYRRSWFSAAFADSVEGKEYDPDAVVVPGWQGEFGEQAEETVSDIGFAVQMIGAELRQVRRFAAHESSFLLNHASGPFKITLPGVMTRAATRYKPGVTDKSYPTLDDLINDIVAMLRSEVKALVSEGVPYIQLDSLRFVIQLADPKARLEVIK